MSKHGFLTPKAIGNRIKAKGLQKLRWYCQMCQKQCRDENGFKCHITSESHLRQMRIFAEDPDHVMDEYSQQFEDDFMSELSRRHNTTRVRANLVYNEFIAHKEHVHMNSTKWETLTNFVMYLGKTGKCLVDETEKGWYIQWIDRDPATLARQAADQKKRKVELDDEERQMRAIEAQVRAAQDREANRAPGDGDAGPSEMQRDEDAAALRIALKAGGGAAHREAKRSKPSADAVALPFGASAAAAGAGTAAERESVSLGGASAVGKGKGGAKLSALEALMAEDAMLKQAAAGKAASAAGKAASAAAAASSSSGGASNGAAEGPAKETKDYWLHEGIVVKVLNKKVGDGKYYKQKALVRKVIERYVAEVKLLEGGHRLRLDQDDLETVIPAVGRRVLIVNGRCRGEEAELLSLDTSAYSASVKVLTGRAAGTILEKVEYEELCKLAE